MKICIQLLSTVTFEGETWKLQNDIEKNVLRRIDGENKRSCKCNKIR